VNVNIVFILKSLYSLLPVFNRTQDSCSWKLLQVAVLKHTVHTRLKTRSSMTDIFNLLCPVGTMLQPTLATYTDSAINIRFRNMDVMTSVQIMKLQHVQ
jgi:hypothetical protein